MTARQIYTAYLKKASGEGSRGGKVIGHTKSGKPIYSPDSKHYAAGDTSVPHAGHVEEAYNKHGYTAEDHRDAAFRHHAQTTLARHELKEKKFDPEHGLPGGRVWEARVRAAKIHRQVADKMDNE